MLVSPFWNTSSLFFILSHFILYFYIKCLILLNWSSPPPLHTHTQPLFLDFTIVKLQWLKGMNKVHPSIDLSICLSTCLSIFIYLCSDHIWIRFSPLVTAWHLPSVSKKPRWCWQQPFAHIRTPGDTLYQDRATRETDDLKLYLLNVTFQEMHFSTQTLTCWVLSIKIGDIYNITLQLSICSCVSDKDPYVFYTNIFSIWKPHDSMDRAVYREGVVSLLLHCPLRWIAVWLTLMPWTNHHWAVSDCQDNGISQVTLCSNSLN